MKLVESLDETSKGPIADITAKMLERQALPIGKTQFIEWSDRIIQGAHIEASQRSLRWALAEMIMHLSPTEAFKEDAHFILKLRKGAVNETARAMMVELKAEQDLENKSSNTPGDTTNAEVLGDKTL